MKKLILFAAILFAGVSVVKAEGSATIATPTEQTTTANFTLTLNPVQSIIVNQAKKDVNLIYSTIANYTDGNTVEMDDHLVVYSVGGFEVKVKSDAASLNNVESIEENILANYIKLNATQGTVNPYTADFIPDVPLTVDAATLFSSVNGTINSSFKVSFSGPGENIFANPNYFKKSAGKDGVTTHTTEVTYTILPK